MGQWPVTISFPKARPLFYITVTPLHRRLLEQRYIIAAEWPSRVRIKDMEFPSP